MPDESNIRAHRLGPSILLRAEALAALLVSAFAYGTFAGFHWGMYALLFFAPDVALIPYFFGPGRLKAFFYNATHSEVGSLALLAASFPTRSSLLLRFSLIWIGHVAFDRVLGYGLKYGNSFRFTHLQAIDVESRSNG